MKKSIVVVGAGRGLGNHVAKRFACENFRVALVARSHERLKAYADEFRQEGIEVMTVRADATDGASIREAFAEITRRMGTPDVVVYNVGITTPDEHPLTSADIERHFLADVVGAYNTIESVATDEFAARRGTIICTGGNAAFTPYPGYLCLAMTKAALRNLVLVKNGELRDRGIFVGTVMVCGAIGTDGHFAPANIAERFWQMYTERNDWELKYE